MKNNCPYCSSGTLINKQVTESFKHNDISLSYARVFCECDNCGMQATTAVQMRLNARAQQRAKNLSDGLLVGTEIREFRKKLNLDQVTAATLFGGGPTAFAKYEVDEIAHNGAMDRLLRLCMAQPSLILELAKLKDVSLSGDTLSVILGELISKTEKIRERVKEVMRSRAAASSGFSSKVRLAVVSAGSGSSAVCARGDDGFISQGYPVDKTKVLADVNCQKIAA